MNLFGSYRALLANSIAAISAAIEIYNKPGIRYREECFVILLVNGWELLLKALLSKAHQRIYYPKRKNESYRTLSVSDALERARNVFPSSVDHRPTAKNLELIIDYRDNAIHFYNKPGFGAVVYGLAQTAIANYRDVVQSVFNRDLTRKITLSLLPLGLAPPVDPVAFIRSSANDPKMSAEVRAFTQRLRDLVTELEAEGADTGRLLTTFHVKLESTKKLAAADLVVGVQGEAPEGSPLLVQRSVDPNKSHPYRESDIIGSPRRSGLGLTVGGRPLGQYEFRAIGCHHKVTENTRWCWRDTSGVITRYSPEWVQFIQRLAPDDVNAAVAAYRQRLIKRTPK